MCANEATAEKKAKKIKIFYFALAQNLKKS